jgi:hypothetical protein
MPLLLAIGFSIVLALGTWFLGAALGIPGLTMMMVIGTAVWVFIDARRLRLQHYRTGLTSPVVAAVGCIFLWIVAFPWYLSTRHKIVRGEIRPHRFDEREIGI